MIILRNIYLIIVVRQIKVIILKYYIIGLRTSKKICDIFI